MIILLLHYQVKENIFPEYHGAALAKDPDIINRGVESEDSEIEEEGTSDDDPEAAAARDR